MAVTSASLTLDVEDILYGMASVERPREDTLATLVTDAVDVSWRFSNPTFWKHGDYAEYAPVSGATGEVVILGGDHPAASDVTVRRAQQQTSAAGGFSAGDVFRRNPLFPRVKIERMVDEIIDNHLWPHIWLRTPRTLSYTAGTQYYNLNVADYDVEEVYQYNLNSATNYNFFPQEWWRVVSDLATGMVASTRGLILDRVYDATATVYYTAKTKTTAATVTTLTDQMGSCVVWGACWLLLATRVAPTRFDALRNAGVTEQTPPEQILADARWFEQRFFQARDEIERQMKAEKRPHRRYYRTLVGRRG